MRTLHTHLSYVICMSELYILNATILCYNSLFMKLYGCVCVHVYYRTYSLAPVVHISIFAEYLCLSIYTHSSACQQILQNI